MVTDPASVLICSILVIVVLLSWTTNHQIDGGPTETYLRLIVSQTISDSVPTVKCMVHAVLLHVGV